MEIRSSLLPDVSMGAHQHIFGKTRWAPPKSSSKEGEGGEQGDPLMPMLFALGQYPALPAAQARLQDDERVFACLHDIHAVCRPDRVGAVFAILQQELQSHAHIQLHLGKTQVWNKGGVVPVGIEQLTRLARRVKPDAKTLICH